MNWEEKSNNQILKEMNEMKIEHEKFKSEIIRLYDAMVELEKQYDQANKEINKRLKGER